jgi:hypothetical protein
MATRPAPPSQFWFLVPHLAHRGLCTKSLYANINMNSVSSLCQHLSPWLLPVLISDLFDSCSVRSFNQNRIGCSFFYSCHFSTEYRSRWQRDFCWCIFSFCWANVKFEKLLKADKDVFAKLNRTVSVLTRKIFGTASLLTTFIMMTSDSFHKVALIKFLLWRTYTLCEVSRQVLLLPVTLVSPPPPCLPHVPYSYLPPPLLGDYKKGFN